MKDYARDKNKVEFFKLHRMNDLPGFVKEACLMEESALGKLQSSQFAEPLLRMFPINTRAETWVSAAYMQKQAAEGATIRKEAFDLVKEACELFDVSFDSIRVASLEKAASNYVTIQYKDDTSVYAAVPAQEGEHLDKIASDILCVGNHTHDIRGNVARQVLGAAATMNHFFDESTQVALEKTACYGVGSLPVVQEAISQRRLAIAKIMPHHVESMHVLSKYASDSCGSDTDIVAGEVLDKIARVLDAVDRENNLHLKYGDNFRTPALQLCSVSVSQVDGYNNNLVKLANGRTFMLDGFSHNKTCEFLVDVFNKEASDLRGTMEGLSARQADALASYIDKEASEPDDTIQAVDEIEVPDEAPVHEEVIADVDKAKPVKGQDNVSDESTPREPNNEDSTPRIATQS